MKSMLEMMSSRFARRPASQRTKRALSAGWLVVVLLFGVTSVSALQSSKIVPTPKISLSASTVSITAQAGQLERSSIAVRNNRGCSVDLDTRNFTKHGVKVSCPRGRLGPHESMTCEITLQHSNKGKYSQYWSARGIVDLDCKQAAYAKVDAREKLDIKPHKKKLESMPTMNDMEQQWDEKRKTFIKEQKAKVAALEKKLKDLPEKHNQKLDKLESIWAEAKREQDRRIDRQEKKLKMAKLDDTALKAVDAEIKDKQIEARNDIDRLNAAKIRDCDKPSRIDVQKQQAYEELRMGAYHDKCNRTQSEILREEGETLTQHLGKYQGNMIPAPQDVIDKRMADFDKKIAEAKKQCGNAQRAQDAATQVWIKRVRDVQAKREKVEAKRAKVVLDIQNEIYQLEENARLALVKHQERIDTLSAEHRKTVRELKLEIADLKDAQRVELQAFETKREEALRAHSDKRSKVEQKISDIQSKYTSIRSQIYSSHLKKSRAEALIQTEIL